MLPTEKEIQSWFTHGADDPAKDQKFTELHAAGRTFALAALAVLPDRPESQKAMDAIQEAVMWATAAISRG